MRISSGWVPGGIAGGTSRQLAHANGAYARLVVRNTRFGGQCRGLLRRRERERLETIETGLHHAARILSGVAIVHRPEAGETLDEA